MAKEIQKDMAKRIKERRKSLGCTQEQVAESIGISTSSYTRIENAFQNPALETLSKISQRLNLSLDYLVFGTEERKPQDVTNADLIRQLLKAADHDALLKAGEFLTGMAKLREPKE